MKKILIGLVALTMFAGCSKDDNVPDNNQNYETLIQGNWQIVKESVIIYDADNKVLNTLDIDDAVGVKWKLEEGVLTSYEMNEEEIGSGTYVVNEKADPPTLLIKEDGNGEDEEDSQTMLNITALNETDMVLEVSQDLSGFPESDELPDDADHAVIQYELEHY